MLLAFIKLPFVIKIFVLSVFEWPFYTGFFERLARFYYVTSINLGPVVNIYFLSIFHMLISRN